MTYDMRQNRDYDSVNDTISSNTCCVFICLLTKLQVDSYDVRVGEDLGDIVLVKIEKKKYWVHDDWYCRYITVKTPSGEYLEFPCFRWLVDEKEVVLRDGRGTAIGFICLVWSLRCEKSANRPPMMLHPSLCLVSVVAHLPQDDKTSLVKQHRQKELDMRRKTYRQVHSAHVCYRRLRLHINVQ